MKFSLSLFATLLLVTTTSVQARDLTTIEQSGTLKVGVPGDYAPLAWHNDQGTLQGYDVDMARALGKSLGLNVTFVLTSWPGIAKDLAADKFDVAMGGVTATAQREAEFGLSAPVVPNGKIAIANCDRSGKFDSMQKIDQSAVKVVVNPGGTNESFVNEHIHHAQIIRVKNNVDNLQALRDKTADIMFTDLIEGDYYQHQEAGVICLATHQPFAGTESNKVYMVQKSNSELLTKINSWLQGDDKIKLAQKWSLSMPEAKKAAVAE